VNLFERAIAELAGAFASAADAMLGVVRRFFSGDTVAIGDAHSQIDEIADALEEDSQDWAEDVLPEVYAEGMRVSLSASETPDVPPGELSEDVHDETLDLFIEGLVAQLGKASQSLAESAKEEIREAARQRLAASLRGEPEQVEAFERDLQRRGITFVDNLGRKWNARAYAEMVLRTHTVSVMNQGMINTADELGAPGVRVIDALGGDTDQPCMEANGQAWSLGYARFNRLQHPNCSRSFTPLPTDFDGELDK
jgi:Phage minor capsid protein 2